MSHFLLLAATFVICCMLYLYSILEMQLSNSREILYLSEKLARTVLIGH